MAEDPVPNTTTTFFAAPGNIIKVTRPLGYPPGDGGGFALSDTGAGEIIEISQDYIKYKHNSFKRQTIVYTSKGGVKPLTFYLVVDSIVNHDHASIAMGGPAFATYYTEVPTEEGG